MNKHSSLLVLKISDKETCFMAVRPVANLKKTFFQCNLRCYEHIDLTLDSGNAVRKIIYTKKSFMKSTPGADLSNEFCSTLTTSFCKVFI